MHYSVKVDGTTKTSANLLKRYFEREEALMGTTIKMQMDITFVAVIGAESENNDFVIRR